MSNHTQGPSSGQGLENTNFHKFKTVSRENCGIFSPVEIKRQERMHSCGSWLQFNECITDDIRFLKQAKFCRDRMCAMCNWRKSISVKQVMSQVATHLVESEKSKFLFLTLTIKNCEIHDLRVCLSSMNKAFSKMINRNKRIKNAVKGYFKAIEVTYNDRTNTFHPHIHAILSVDNAYFKKSDYVKHSEWLDGWREAYGDYNITQVNVKRMKMDNEFERFNAVSEAVKYSLKPSLFTMKDKTRRIKVLKELKEEWRDIRLFSTGGNIKSMVRLVTDDKEIDEASMMDDYHSKKCPICNHDFIERWWGWFQGRYHKIHDETQDHRQRKHDLIREANYRFEERKAIQEE